MTMLPLISGICVEDVKYLNLIVVLSLLSLQCVIVSSHSVSTVPSTIGTLIGTDSSAR